MTSNVVTERSERDSVNRHRAVDPQTLVILGNHYSRQDSQRATALKLIRRAFELAPDDAP